MDAYSFQTVPLCTPQPGFGAELLFLVQPHTNRSALMAPQVKPPPPRSRVTLQGRFKRPFSFEDLLTGQASRAQMPSHDDALQPAC